MSQKDRREELAPLRRGSRIPAGKSQSKLAFSEATCFQKCPKDTSKVQPIREDNTTRLRSDAKKTTWSPSDSNNPLSMPHCRRASSGQGRPRTCHWGREWGRLSPPHKKTPPDISVLSRSSSPLCRSALLRKDRYRGESSSYRRRRTCREDMGPPRTG